MSPRHSGAAAPEPAPPGTANRAAVLDVAEVLAHRGVFGILWLDEALVVTGRFGAFVDWVATGVPAADALLALAGYEDELHALRDDPSGLLDLSNIAIGRPGRSSLRINVHAYWAPARRQYVVLVSRVSAQSDFDRALTQQTRARQLSDERLAEVNGELTRVNADLEAFAGVVSHDLKSPLRALRYLCEDVEAALAAGGGVEAARPLLAGIHGQARRMSEMVGGLLEYSSIGKKREVIERVDTGALARRVVASLPAPDGIALEVSGAWPTIDTLAAPLDVVLRNLADNAIKHHDREDGYVRLSAREERDRIVLDVADDGPGIPPGWHAQVFEPFSALGGTRGAESSGMGLAIVKRTLDVHGGTIAIVSDPAVRRGTTFRVTWPRVMRI